MSRANWVPLLTAVGFVLWVAIGSAVAWLFRRVLGALEEPGSFGEVWEITAHATLWPLYLLVFGLIVLILWATHRPPWSGR